MRADRLYSFEEAAQLMSLSVPQIKRLCRQGLLERYVLGHRTVRISEGSIAKYQRQCRVGPGCLDTVDTSARAA